MDVSIAVSLLRGQMGAVVERAVSGAVETVLSEMLRAVGVKFEELKAELLRAKREAALLQREKVQREKESECVRAKLRYAELKLKYYRQGVEEELQHRAALAHSFRQGVLRSPTAPQCTTSQRAEELTVSDWETWERYSGQTGDTLSHWEQTVEPVQVVHKQEEDADEVGSATLPPAVLQVKQEVQWEEEEEEELICVKEEPQEVKIPLLQPDETQGWLTPPPNPTNQSAAIRLASQSNTPLLAPHLPPPLPGGRPWRRELCLYEELKLRRRNLDRHRALQEGLPPPLLSELDRERREKTRLRVARWRAKRKLQAQAEAGTVSRAEFHLLSTSSALQQESAPHSPGCDQQRLVEA